MDRDYSLDFMKGTACILMVLAHYFVIPQNTPHIEQAFAFTLNFLGGLAPVLFFAVSGVTSLFQSRKSMKTIFVFYVIFALIGLTYNMIIRPHLYAECVCDIPQIIAIAVIVVVLTEKYLHPIKEFYLISGIGFFLMHFFVTRFIPSFPGGQFLFAPGVFPIFPWLFVFFMGVYAYRSMENVNLFCSLVSLILLMILHFAHKINLDIYNKFDMSAGYFLLSVFFLFFMFYIGKKLKFNSFIARNIILYFGKYSLLFLYVHFFVISLFESFKLDIILSYILILAFTLILMKFLIFLNSFIEKAFNNYFIWMSMLVIIFIIPLLKSVSVIQHICFILGFLFACNYHALSELIRQSFEKSR